jgi:hypothetical protein
MVAGYKINAQKSIVVLYTINIQPKNFNQENNFIAPKGNKIWINLTEEVWNSHNEYHKTSKKFEKIYINGMASYVHGLGDLILFR